MQESSDEFLALFPHRYDYIYAKHPLPRQRPQWQTESRHPLSDRLIEQGSYLYGVRFGQKTNYALLDIDIGSAYHPRRDPIAFQRLLDALEPLDLVSYLICTSSDSQGVHIYFPFTAPLTAWEVGSGISLLLETKGFKVQPGQIEVFPNARLYTIESTPNLFNAHRLPLQQGSYLLNENLDPTGRDHSTFVKQWQHCQKRNCINAKTLQQIIKQKKRKHYRLSNKADKYLNDLNTEIEQGWTGQGQTNRLLGRITMRSYVFHHVMYGSEPLEGKTLIQDIVETARALPGYDIWCQHKHEIEDRATEWTRCIENSHYFHYGEQFGKYKKASDGASEADNNKEQELSWNQKQAQKTKTKILEALSKLNESEQLPDQPTARFNALRKFGIGGGSLYRYKELWHPSLKTPQTPLEEEKSESGQFDCVEDASNCHSSTSLLHLSDGNPINDNVSSGSDNLESQNVDGNPCSEAIAKIRQDLLARQTHRQNAAETQIIEHQQDLALQARAAQLQKMAYWLTLEDPILMAEALAWLHKQSAESCAELLEAEVSDRQLQSLEVIIEIVQQLQTLDWTPMQIQESLRVLFDKGSLAMLTVDERQMWLRILQGLSTDTG